MAWLRADLARWARRLTDGKARDRRAVQATLRHWQKDPDLACVRDKAALAKLPEAERQAWNKFWGEVVDQLAKASAKK
jgi:hypothetical protein